MMYRQYENVDFRVDLDDEGSARAADIVAGAETAASVGHYTHAYEQMSVLIDAAEHLGRNSLGLDLIGTLKELVPSEHISLERRAWLLSTEARLLYNMGRVREAIDICLQMLDIGRQLQDLSITSTAQQQLGNYYLNNDDNEEARRFYVLAAQEKNQILDYRGLTEIMLNLAVLDQHVGNLQAADEALDLVERILEVAAQPEPHMRATLYNTRALLAIKRGDLPLAEKHFRRVLRYAPRANDINMTIRSYVNVARVRAEQDDLTGALKWLQRAVERVDGTDVVGARLDLYQNLAALLYRIGRQEEALVHLRTAQTLADTTDDRLRWARLTADLSAITLDSGSVNEAGAQLTSLLSIFREHHDMAWQLRTLRMLFAAHVMAGDMTAAEDYLNQAAMLLPTDASQELPRLFAYAAQTCLRNHAPSEYAVTYFHRGLTALSLGGAHEGMGTDPSRIAWYCVQAGAALRDLGDDRINAIPFFEQGVATYDSIGDLHMAFHARNDLANELTRLSRFEEAKSYYDSCLALAGTLNDRVMELQTSMNLGELLRRSGDVQGALGLYDRGEELARALGDIRAEGEVLANRATLFEDLKDLDLAKVNFAAAKDLARTLQDSPEGRALEGRSLAGLGNIEFLEKHYRRAARLYTQASTIAHALGNPKEELRLLGAVYESHCAADEREKTEVAAQRIVTLSQEIGGYDIAFRTLARGARWWFRRKDREVAASLFGASILIVMADPYLAKDYSVWLEEILKPIYLMISLVKLDNVDRRAEFYREVTADIERQHPAAGNIVRHRLVALLRSMRKRKRRGFRRGRKSNQVGSVKPPRRPSRSGLSHVSDLTIVQPQLPQSSEQELM